MVLSNAERQARYRRNLKARATDPGSAARAAADAAAAALWGLFNRVNDASVVDHPKFEDWRGKFMGDELVTICRQLLNDPDCSPDEALAIRAVVEIDDALKLKHDIGGS